MNVGKIARKAADYDTSDLLFDDGATIHFTRAFRYLGVKLAVTPGAFYGIVVLHVHERAL